LRKVDGFIAPAAGVRAVKFIGKYFFDLAAFWTFAGK
jgi:hypothetical protein